MEMKIADALGRRRSNRRAFRGANLARVAIQLIKALKKRLHAVRTREHDPVVTVRVLNELGELAQIGRRLDSDRWQLKNISAERAKLARQSACLFPRSRDHDPFSGKRPALVPTQILLQRNDVSKN